jgi:hypothetical protein
MAEATASDIDDKRRPEKGADSEPKLHRMLLKDGAVAFAALSLWAAADTWYQVTGLWLAQIVAVGYGILVGVLLAALFHEWGHYAGAKASGAVAPRISLSGLTLFRYNFKFSANDSRQFHWMTYGGHIGHWSIFLLLVIMLPLDALGRIALVSGAFGFNAFATFIEYNVVKDTWAGADPKTRLNAITSKDFQQATVIGAIAGLFLFAALS